MSKPSDYVWVWNHDDHRFCPEIVAFVSDGYITTQEGDTVDVSDVYPLDAILTYDVSFEGSDKVFTLYAKNIDEAVELARYRLRGSVGQLGMFPAEVESVEELRLY